MRLCLLVLVAFAATAAATPGPLLMTCPDKWFLYHTRHEASCLKIEETPMLFDAAFKSCHDEKARMLSFSHRMEKVRFINQFILKNKPDLVGNTLWFFDPTFMNRNLPKHGRRALHGHGTPEAPEMPKSEGWMVISPSADPSKIELLNNGTAIPRPFICETHARPGAQRPQFQMEPEHLFISDFLVNPTTDAEKEQAQSKPFIVTFNCQTYGMPKPTIEWRLVHKAQNQSLLAEAIDAKVITDPREPLKEPSMTTTTFFNLQRDCEKHRCPAEGIQERSQLVVVNPQFMDLAKNVVCEAKNEFGSVFSREAKLFITKLGEFDKEDDAVTVEAGISTIVPNKISAEPDAASADCYRVVKPAAEAPAQLIPIEHLNRMLHGAIQMSKATFDLIIDSARPEDAGEFMCRARMHNGRLEHVTREKIIGLKVEPCIKADGCDLEAKPVAVAEGFPAVLSMNPLSNRIIRAGDSFLLECPCTGKRRPDEELHVNWNNTDLQAMLVPILPRGSALMVHNANNEAHTGEYSCQCIRGKEKSEWRTMFVQVLPSTEPINHQEVLTIKAGQKASYGCRVNAELTGLGVFVEPMRGTQTLADYIAETGDRHLEIMRGGPTHFTVAFDEAKEADAGIYGCRVTVNYFDKWIEHDTFYTTVIVEK